MPIDLNLIKTIVVVMMENRSFDHLLGYLNLDPFTRGDKVDGLRSDPAWQTKVSNAYKRKKFPPFLLTDPYDLIDADPPHERSEIALQMGTPTNGMFPMDGFVTNYASAEGAKSLTKRNPPPVMGYFTPDEAPVTDFFAQHFAICDHWFSSLPAGTQPNRLMAMSGFSKIDVNQCPLPEQELVYDWLTNRGIRWRVYHDSMPFFGMMLKWIPDIIRKDHFRPFGDFYNDVENQPPDEFPQVIFIEPTYTDAPHIGPSNDDHAPSAIKGGQAFLLEVYRCITRYPDIWDGTVMIVTYDEHGGFFDHVSPPLLRTDPPADAPYWIPFETLGVRVPAFVISPFVEPQTVFNDCLDHTSILKFIGQKFGENGSYSDVVDSRNVGSVFDVLNRANPRPERPVIGSLVPYLKKQPDSAGFVKGSGPNTPLQKSFQCALDTIRTHPDRAINTFDDLLSTFPHRPDI
jgi:phospholipase C